MEVHETAVVYPCVELGDNVYIGANCIIGAPAEHKGLWGTPSPYKVIIGDNTIITGAVTIDAGTVNDTVIGEDCFIMKQAHIGHDAVIGDRCTISPHATIGGHCILGDDVNFGMNSVIHQRAQVLDGCMIGMGTVITMKTTHLKGYIYVGVPALALKPNPKYK